MAKDFKSYMRNGGGRKVSKSDIDKVKSSFSEGELKDAESFVKRYEGKSEGELMNEIAHMARDGNVSEAELTRFAANVSPMLESEQRKKLQQILSMLRR